MSSFGTGGHQRFDFTAWPETGRAIAPFGADFAAIGNYSNAAWTPFALVLRVGPTGALNGTADATFSDDGATQLSGGADDAYGIAIATQSNGRIVIGGSMISSGGRRRALLARVLN